MALMTRNKSLKDIDIIKYYLAEAAGIQENLEVKSVPLFL